LRFVFALGGREILAEAEAAFVGNQQLGVFSDVRQPRE